MFYRIVADNFSHSLASLAKNTYLCTRKPGMMSRQAPTSQPTPVFVFYYILSMLLKGADVGLHRFHLPILFKKPKLFDTNC